MRLLLRHVVTVSIAAALEITLLHAGTVGALSMGMTNADKTTAWNVTNVVTGHDFGDFTATDELSALEAYAVDAGYCSFAEACEVSGTSQEDIGASERLDATVPPMTDGDIDELHGVYR